MIDVQLRAVAEADLPIFFEHQQDAAANWSLAFMGDPTDRAAFDAKWAKILGDPSCIVRTILHDGQVAGFVNCFVAPWSGVYEVGYRLGREHWGRGVATRALATFLAGITLRPLQARAASDNIASIRVLEKCGFVTLGWGQAFAERRGQEVEEIIMELRLGEGGDAAPIPQ